MSTNCECASEGLFIERTCTFSQHPLQEAGFPGGSVVKNLPAMRELQETRVDLWVKEDPPKGNMGAHSSIFAWRIPWVEWPGGLQSMGSESWTRLSD